jgi:hypothetical protein
MPANASKGLALRSNSVKALKDIINNIMIRFLMIIPSGVVKKIIIKALKFRPNSRHNSKKKHL